MPSDTNQRRLSAVLAADVAGYTRRMERDAEGTVAAWQAARREVINPAVASAAGKIVKLTGDGFLAEFPTVLGAVSCALELQQGLASSQLEFRIGVNLGDVIDDGEDIHGEGVNIAARLEALAEPGGICISGSVYEQVRNRIDPVFEDAGEHSVKHVSAPLRVWRWPADRDAVPESEPKLEPAAGEAGGLSLPDKPSIAVLPFDNIGGDPEQEYFSDGITEDIITELSRISGLFVIARHSTFSYKGQPYTLAQVARDLGVRYILEGSVRRAGNRLRVSAQLIDSNSGHCLWAERYDRDLEDIFAVQGEVAHNVAAALQVVLQPEEDERINRPPTENIEAYDIYLQTRSSLWPPTRENLLTARSAYRRIAEIDPDFAGGHAGQSMTYSLTAIFGLSDDPAEDAKLARELADKALAIDPGFAQAHSALGLACTAAGEHGEAVARAREGVELHPGNADSHLFLAFATLFGCDSESAYEAINTALRLDPKYVRGPYLNVLGMICFVAGRYAESADVFQRNIDRGGPIGPPALVFRTAALAADGRADEARDSARELLGFFPGFTLGGFHMLRVFRDAGVGHRTLSALCNVGLPD
jgi:TolB-like protein